MKPGSRKGGVVWHTQGSGKSISMAFYAGKLMQQPEMQNPTIVVVTDRNDLDDQLFSTLLHVQGPAPADAGAGRRPRGAARRCWPRGRRAASSSPPSRSSRRRRTKSAFPALTDRTNIVVIADEAHRSQYGFKAKVASKTGEIAYGFAKYLRDALPNASFIGFTGTPIEATDVNTRAVFGDYISIYDIQRAVDDGATVPIYYESRLAKLELNEDEIDAARRRGRGGAPRTKRTSPARERTKSKWAALEALVGADKRLQQVAADLVQHFEDRVAALNGKAMMVCMSRRICAQLYNADHRAAARLAQQRRSDAGRDQGRDDRFGRRTDANCSRTSTPRRDARSAWTSASRTRRTR
ncbi:MAG: DEAD/DEAH box helicase family protein [Gemmatimonadaceae bacterium]|nr:DEAD/DEAH box helicase family protein [Gemmatimonadaceae bacterium]